MARTPRFKVYDPDGAYIGCTKGADEAVALARYKGVGASVRDGHNISDTVYDVGREPFTFTNEDAAAADIYVVLDTRAKARAIESDAERKRVESMVKPRNPLSLYRKRSGWSKKTEIQKLPPSKPKS